MKSWTATFSREVRLPSLTSTPPPHPTPSSEEFAHDPAPSCSKFLSPGSREVLFPQVRAIPAHSFHRPTWLLREDTDLTSPFCLPSQRIPGRVGLRKPFLARAGASAGLEIPGTAECLRHSQSSLEPLVTTDGLWEKTQIWQKDACLPVDANRPEG